MKKAAPVLLDYWPIVVGILLAGMWLGALQMQVLDLRGDHDYHWGKDTH